jgi:hypothetical protein
VVLFYLTPLAFISYVLIFGILAVSPCVTNLNCTQGPEPQRDLEKVLFKSILIYCILYWFIALWTKTLLCGNVGSISIKSVAGVLTSKPESLSELAKKELSAARAERVKILQRSSEANSSLKGLLGGD